GRCFSKRASTPGVWAMSPMFTVCQEERRMMRGARPVWAAMGDRVAARAVARKWRRVIIKGECLPGGRRGQVYWSATDGEGSAAAAEDGEAEGEQQQGGTTGLRHDGDGPAE